MDRTIDVSTVSSVPVIEKMIDAFGNTVPNQTRTRQVTVRQVRKRVPTGGIFNDFTQKPFLFYRVVNTPMFGEWSYPAGGGYTWMQSGAIAGSFNVNGVTFALSVESFPPIGGAKYNLAYPPAINPDLLSQAEVKCLNKLRGRSGEAEMNYGLWYGERKETARMFRDAAFGLLNVARSIAQKDYARSARVLRDAFGVRTSAKAEARRMERVEKWIKHEARQTGKRANRTLKGVENAVLNYNLGVSPLLKDLDTVNQRLQTGDLTVKCAILVKARHSRVDQDVYRQSTGEWNYTVQLSRTHGYTVTLVAVPKQGNLAELSRVGLTNPANTAYQLTGGSFIVDYFLPLGPYLQSLDVPLSFDFKQGSWTHRVVQLITGTVESPGGKKAKGQSVLDYTKRTIYGAFPMPIPPLSLREDSLSFRQALNAGLLATKQLRKLCGL